MKNALIMFKNPAVRADGEYMAALADALFAGGFSVDFTEILPSGDAAAFRHALARFKDVADNLIITDGESTGFDLKAAVAEEQGSVLEENENALKFARAVSAAGEEDRANDFAMLPIDSTLIPNVLGLYQGFMMEDRDFTLMVLPEETAQYRQACEKYVLPYLEKKYGLNNRRLTLKYFGNREELTAAVEEAALLSTGGFKWNVREDCGDFTLSLLFEHYDESNGADVIRFIVSKLKDSVYAEYDTTLAGRLFDMLKLYKLRISAAESFTGGRVISSLIENPGASEAVYEGIVAYSNDSKERRLGVKFQDLKQYGAVSSRVAYGMAAGLLSEGKADIAIATTGIAGPKSDGTDKPVGLCYIAVGMKDGIHTYRFDLSGSRERITETAKNTALFLAIKRLKAMGQPGGAR